MPDCSCRADALNDTLMGRGCFILVLLFDAVSAAEAAFAAVQGLVSEHPAPNLGRLQQQGCQVESAHTLLLP